MRKRRRSFRKPSLLLPNRWRGSSTIRELVPLKAGCCIRPNGGLATSFARDGATGEGSSASTKPRRGQRPLNEFLTRRNRNWKQSGRRNGEVACSLPLLRE